MKANTRIPKIVERTHWTAALVRQCCINHEYYTRGDNEEYEEMLDYVRANEPTVRNIYLVAADILEHSDTCNNLYGDVLTVSHIMYILKEETVYTTYEVDGEEY